MDKQTHARGWAMNAHMKKNKAGEAVMMDQAWKWGSHFTQDYQVSTCIEVTFTWSSEFKGVTGILTTDAKDPRQKPAWYIWKEALLHMQPKESLSYSRELQMRDPQW